VLEVLRVLKVFRVLRVLFVALPALCAASANAQLVGPAPAELAPLVETDGVSAGGEARVALAVRLPLGYHANSNKPRDSFLIPMTLTVRPPGGIVVTEIVYPPAVDLKQENSEIPLSVFERDFTIGVRLNIGGEVPPGEIRIPAELRYQACDDKACYRRRREIGAVCRHPVRLG
jgi:thiol:disulfide interchange protein DsbD